jgi:hypothetical protein
MKRICILILLFFVVALTVILRVKPCPKVIEVKPIEPQTPAEIKSYIIQEAKAAHVNLIQVEWIAKHESQWGQRTVGDVNNGLSLGVWQINLKRNPSISVQCALSTICATRQALVWLKEGRANKWATWRFRCSLYPKDDPPGCRA